LAKFKKLYFNKEDLIRYCQEILIKTKVPRRDAEIISKLLVKTEQRGVHTHGLVQLPIYVKRLLVGLANPSGKMKITNDRNASAIIDANDCLGHLSSYKGMKLAIKKAKKFSVGIVAIKNSQHFGEAALYSMMAAKNDMIGFATTNALALMAPAGGMEEMVGNNPFSYAIPAGNEFPIVLDIACSVVAGKKIILKGKFNEKIPVGWALDKEGKPLEDANKFSLKDGCTLLPIAMHKGYGLALIMDILSGGLSGSAMGLEVNSLVNMNTKERLGVGHFFMAINISSFVSINEFKLRIDERISQIKSSKKINNIKRIYIPGEIEFLNQRNSNINGIPLDIFLVEELEKLASELGVNKKLSLKRIKLDIYDN